MATEAVHAPKRRFNVDEYHQMAAAGILTEDDRVELIEGEIVYMMVIGNRHAGCLKHLNQLFVLGLGYRALIGVQDPVRLSERNEPQPDLSVLRPRADSYSSGHPTPEDVLLLVEVADTSATYERSAKVPLYARHGIRELWLVDLNADLVEVHRQPTDQGYLEVTRHRRGETVTPEALGDFSLSVDQILG